MPGKNRLLSHSIYRLNNKAMTIGTTMNACCKPFCRVSRMLR